MRKTRSDSKVVCRRAVDEGEVWRENDWRSVTGDGREGSLDAVSEQE
jgi:hypothetical protein